MVCIVCVLKGPQSKCSRHFHCWEGSQFFNLQHSNQLIIIAKQIILWEKKTNKIMHAVWLQLFLSEWNLLENIFWDRSVALYVVFTPFGHHIRAQRCFWRFWTSAEVCFEADKLLGIKLVHVLTYSAVLVLGCIRGVFMLLLVSKPVKVICVTVMFTVASTDSISVIGPRQIYQNG